MPGRANNFYYREAPLSEANSSQCGTKSLQASQKAAMKLSDDNWETLRREFEERWLAQTTKERRVIQSGIFEEKSFSIFDDGSIEIKTGSGIKKFKDFAELRAVAAANGQEGNCRTESPDAH
jgi:hypothetical protein